MEKRLKSLGEQRYSQRVKEEEDGARWGLPKTEHKHQPMVTLPFDFIFKAYMSTIHLYGLVGIRSSEGKQTGISIRVVLHFFLFL
jgi:hypothetical protein